MRSPRAAFTASRDPGQSLTFSQFLLAMDSYPPHYTVGLMAGALTWLLGGTVTSSAVIGVGFGYLDKRMHGPGSHAAASASLRPSPNYKYKY